MIDSDLDPHKNETAMTTPLAALYQHNLWANLLSLEACSKLTDVQMDATAPGTYGTIRDTWKHIAGAEGRYVNLLRGEPRGASLEHEPFPGFDKLRALLTQSGQALVEIAERARPGEVLHGTNRDGVPFEIPASIILIQAINHATEHRAHINVILTTLGAEAPDLDGWAYSASLEHQQ